MQPVLADVMARRRDRAIAIILSLKERECDPHLPRDASQKLRKVVLDQFNEFYDMCVDVMKSLDDGDVALNGHYLDRMVAQLDEIHKQVMTGTEV